MEGLTPKDRFYGVWIIFLLHGIGTLLPWNMFITANDYFVNYKFNPVNQTSLAQNYGHNYLAYVGVASKLPNLALQAMNFLYTSKSGSIHGRIIISLLIQMILFVLTIVLAVLDSSSWVNIFFAFTMISIVAINMANGIYQSCLFGLAANLPMIYTNSVVTGMNISGTYSALILILSITISPDQKSSAIFYFTTAVVFLIICIITYFMLINNKFFQHFQSIDPSARQSIVSSPTSSKPQNSTLLRQIWRQILIPSCNVFMVFFVSLALFPAVLANIKPMNNLLPAEYFSPIVCFLFFNFFAVIGNLISGPVTKLSRPVILTIPIVARLLFIPFFLFCNFNPTRRTLPVIFDHDYYPIVGTILLALSQGYYTSKAQMYLPKCVELCYARVAGMIASFMVMIGILSGVTFSPVLSYIVELKWN